MVEIYVDGACSGNPGPGGYGVILRCGRQEKELSAGFKLTTNNRMELLAAIRGLEALKHPCQVKLYSDSKYLTDSFNLGRLERWAESGALREENSIKNPDLWRQLFRLNQIHRIEWIWIKGHAQNSFNNRCDQLAVEARKGFNLKRDYGYEKQR